ncbi:alginate lyase family protein [Leeia sp.]|uniref:alginate lyase family protein n=1 Tax=Leeia sp. TaxID=2884678 RepID=UPI0035B2F509
MGRVWWLVLLLWHGGAGAWMSPYVLRAPLQPDNGKACVATPAAQRDVIGVSFYTDAQHSEADPALVAANKTAAMPLDTYLRQVQSWSNRYVRLGDAAAARCAGQWLQDWAQGQALLGKVNPQGEYERKWRTGGLALAYLQVKPQLPLEQRQQIEGWLLQLATAVQQRYAARKRESDFNNHAYWAGWSVMTVAVATERQALFDWACDQYRLGLAELQEDGTLPREMARGKKALAYHQFALLPLVWMAELASRQGVNLYEERERRLSRLVSRVLDSLADPGWMAQQAGRPQEPVSVKGLNASWMWLWQQHHPDARLQRWLQGLTSLQAWQVGGDVLLWQTAE